MAFFVLVIVAVVVGQTWLDWRQARKDLVIPDWAKGAALGGLFAISIAAATSFASVWMQDAATQPSGGFEGRAIWSQGLFLAIMAAILITAARKKHMRWTLIAVGGVVAVCWLGVTIFS